MTRPFAMFGISHLFGDIVDCIDSVDGRLDRIYLNVPETVKPGRPTLQERLARLSWTVAVLELPALAGSQNILRAEDWGFVLGFSRKQAVPLLRELRDRYSIGPSAPLIHRTAIRQMGVEIGSWSILNAGAIVGSWSKIGKNVILNRGANVGHDCEIGDFAFVAPSAVLCGHVTLEADVFVGANATILPDICVGSGAVIAAGAVVTEDVLAGMMVAGVPAQVKGRSRP